jgi:hypothetical protein
MKEKNIVFKGWLNFWNWVKALFSSSDEASSKRFIGYVLIISLITLTFFVAKKYIDLPVWEKIESWCRALLYSADLFLGLGAIIDGAKIIKNYTPVGGSAQTDNPAPVPLTKARADYLVKFSVICPDGKTAEEIQAAINTNTPFI